MKKSRLGLISLNAVVGICLLMLASTSLHAARLTYKVTGIGSGSIGAQTFTNAQITIEGTGDTSNLQSYVSYDKRIPISSATISIAGIGTAVLDAANLFFISQATEFPGDGAFGFDRSGGGGASRRINAAVDIRNSANLTFNSLLNPFGPFSGETYRLFRSFGFPTSLGEITFSSSSQALTIQATEVVTPPVDADTDGDGLL